MQRFIDLFAEFMPEFLGMMTADPLGWVILLASLLLAAWVLKRIWNGRFRHALGILLIGLAVAVMGYLLAPGIGTGGHGSGSYYLPLIVLFLSLYFIIVFVVTLLLAIPIGLLGSRHRRLAATNIEEVKTQ